MSAAPFPPSLELRCGPVTAIDLALFAAASGDHNPLHLDIETARAAGFDKPVVHGMLTMACAGRLLSHHFGAGSVRALQTRFTGVAKLGDTIVLGATLTAADAGEAHYTLHAHTVTGTELMTGQARVSATVSP
jgi:acyl dehydratase